MTGVTSYFSEVSTLVRFKTPQVTLALPISYLTHTNDATLPVHCHRKPDHFRNCLRFRSVAVRAHLSVLPRPSNTNSPCFSGNVSAQCQSSLTNIVASPDAQCLNAAGSVPVLLGGSDASVIGPINTWLTGMCPKDACSNQTLAAFVNNITRGCSSDFSSLGLSDDNIPSITNSVQRYYPTVRQILCLKE